MWKKGNRDANVTIVFNKYYSDSDSDSDVTSVLKKTLLHITENLEYVLRIKTVAKS